MQPELAPEELDAPLDQEPTGPGPHVPPPNSSPAARPALLERTYLFIKEQKLKDVADALPADYQEFEDGMLADPSNVKALHAVFKQEKWEGADLNDRQFSELLLGGLKKKALSPAGGGDAGAIASTGGPTAGPASPTPATPTATEPTAADEEFLPENAPLPGGPDSVGVGQVPAMGEPAPGLVNAQDYPAYLAADPERYAAAVEAERTTLPKIEDGYERVALPQGAAGPDAEGTYMARNSQTGQRYLDRPLSKEVEGEGEQGLGLAAARNMNNLIADGFKGLATAADDATRLISSATGASRGGAFADVAGVLEKTKKPVAPYYQSHDLMAHPNAKNLLMATSDVAGMAIPLLAQALAPEAGLGQVAARIAGTGAGLMFDGQILQGAHDRATAAGMSPDQVAAYTFLEGGLSIALFKGGGALLGKVAGKLTPEGVKSEILRETYRILAGRTGKQLSREELAGVLQQATAAATPRLLKIAAEGGKLGTLFGVNEAKNILTESVARQTIGAKFTAPTLGEAVKRVVGAATEGAVIGGLTGAALPAPKRTLVLGQTPEGRPLSVELNAAGEPERFLDDQGPVDFGPQGPPAAVQAAVAKAQAASPAPLAAAELSGHRGVPTGKYVGANELLADYDLQGKATRLYTEKGGVFTLDDPQVRALVESKWPDAPKNDESKPKEKPAAVPETPAPAAEAPIVSAQIDESPAAPEPAPLPDAVVGQSASPAPLYGSAGENPSVAASKTTAAPLDVMALEIQPDPQDPTKATFTLNPQASQPRLIGDGLSRLQNFFDYNQPVAKIQGLAARASGRMELRDGTWHVVEKAQLRVEDGSAESSAAAAGGPASPAEPTTPTAPTDGESITPGAGDAGAIQGGEIPAASGVIQPTTGSSPSNSGDTGQSAAGAATAQEAVGGAIRPEPLPKSPADVRSPVLSAPKPYATPPENRAAGAFEKDGQVYTRQAPLGEKVARGKQATAEFSAGVQQLVQYAVMEAADLQPSHLGGSQNLNHFLPEAQPKNRSAAYDPASQKAIADIAAAPDLARLGEAPNAYSGAPIVNQRGEALQGNGRAAGVREHYRTGGESYRADVVAAAEKAGIPAEQTARFKEPVLVRIADVSDAKARELGNYTAADTESGGKRRLDVRQAAGRMRAEDRTTLARLATPRGDATLTETIRGNAEAVLRFLRTGGLVNETQLQTMVKSDGTLTPSGVEDITALYRQQLFRDGDPNLPELFAELPAAAQGGLDRAVGALLGVPEAASIVPDVQDAMYGVREYLVSGADFSTWSGQVDMFKGGLAPRERYSPLALKLVEKLTTEKRPTYIARMFNEYAAAVRNEGASLFGETPPQSRAEAVENTFGVKDEPAPGNPRAEEGAPRPGDADQRPPAPGLPAVPGANGAGEAVPPANGRAAEPAGPAGVDGDTRAAGPKFFADLAEAPPVMAQPGRIIPDPIRGEKPKAQDQIVLDLRKGSGVSLVFSKRPGGRKGSRALGSYNPRNAAVTVKAAADLDVTAHEVGHALDDAHDLLPKASPAALAEIQPLSQFGSQPPAGHPDPQRYRDGEALAEYVRAYLVNPAATKAAYPEFTKHYEATVPARMRAAVDGFGRDIRVFAGATAHEQVMSNVRMKPVEKTGIMGVLKPETVGNGGKFMLTFGDRVQATMLNALHPFEKAMRYAQEVTGQDLLPSENPTVLARLFAGLNDKMDNQMREGLVDSRNERRIDQQTGSVKNLTWLLDPLDKMTAGTIEAEQELVVSAKIARRTVELVERRVAEEIESAHGRGESVPDALLQQNPAWQQKFGADNARLKGQPGNVEAVIDEHQTDTVSGVGAGVFTDLAVARQRLADHDALAVSNPTQHARIEEAGRRYESWADDNLRYLLERGRIGQEQYDAIKENNAQYIAMQRIMEAEPGAEIEVLGRGPGGKSFTAVKQPLQKIKGSGRTIKNPYSSLLDATYRVTREGDRNAIMQSFRDLFTGSRTMYDGQAEDLAAVARPAAEGDPHSVSVFVDGQREYWQLDADVFQAINELSNTPLSGPLAKVLQSPAKLLRWTVTNSPVFAVRNLIRDTRSRLIISTNRPEAGFDLLTNKDARRQSADGLDLAGGGQAGHYLSSETAYYDTMQQTMRGLARDKRMILADPGKWASGAWHNYTRLLGGSETIGRRMEYRAAFKEARRKGLDDYNASLHAALEARDLMDFAVAGTFMREVNKYVPFTNAAVQGLRRAGRSIKDNPGGFAARWTLYSLVPTILVRGLIHKMGRDDEYAQLPAYQRDGFDNIPLPQGKWLVIPRPFELGTMAASADRFLSQQMADDPQAWEGYFTGSGDNALTKVLSGSVAKSFVPIDESAIAGGLKPVLEVLTNHDFFKDKSIIAPAEAKLDVDLRHTERGSRLGQWVGGAVGMDSRNVDHLVSGLGSYYGNWVLKASNFGREDGGQSFGLPDTGFLKEQPVTQARDVQWMQQKLEGAGLGQSKPARDLGKLLEFYYAQKTPEGKRQAGELATEYARTLRSFLNAELLKQVGQAKKAQRDAKK